MDLDSALQKSFVAQPKTMLRAFKNSTAQMSLNSAHKSNYAQNSANLKDSTMQIYAAPLALAMQGDGLKGSMFGFGAGFAYFGGQYILQTNFAYSHGTSNQNLSTQSTNLQGDLVQINALSRLFFFERLEADFGVGFLVGRFSVKNAWFSDDSMNLNADFNNYQLDFSATIGWRFGSAFSIKPFVGAQTHFESQNKFRQNGGLGIANNGYNALIIGALAGAEMRYDFTNGIFIFTKAQYEIFSLQKDERFALNGANLNYQNENYKHIISANVGASFALPQSLKLDLETLYQRYNDGQNYFGGSVAVKWRF